MSERISNSTIFSEVYEDVKKLYKENDNCFSKNNSNLFQVRKFTS